jgi:hypothetical protein
MCLDDFYISAILQLECNVRDCLERVTGIPGRLIDGRDQQGDPRALPPGVGLIPSLAIQILHQDWVGLSSQLLRS